MAPPKPQGKIFGITGNTYLLGHFCLKLNIKLKRLFDLGEEFHLILSPNALPNENRIPLFSFPEFPQSEWMHRVGQPKIYSGFPFRIALPFAESKDGKGYAESSILCCAINAEFSGCRFATLAYDQPKVRGVGIPIFRNVEIESLRHWNIRQLEGEKQAATAENRSKRLLLTPSAWQPETPFGGPADLHLWRLPDPLPLVDGHLHIQSNHTAPLPLVWDKLPVGDVFEFLRIGWDSQIPDPKTLVKGVVIGALGAVVAGAPGAVFGLGGMIARQFSLGKIKPGLDGISGLLFGESGRIGGLPTHEIGKTLATNLKMALDWDLPFFSSEGPHALATPLPMDMHYGHFRGYHGEPIYKMENGVFTFLLNPFESKRGAISFPDTKAYEQFDTQILRTIKAATTYKWKILPLYHYDPRRWMGSAEKPEKWDTPFQAVITAKSQSQEKWPFIGFKCYTSLGYMPMDAALPHQEKFYSRCEADGIPIMNHCTTAGMYTHDKPFFYDLWKSDTKLNTLRSLDTEIESIENKLAEYLQKFRLRIVDRTWKNLEKELIWKKIAWFDRHYVFPSAWEPVIQRWPKLKLCLAHFGGYDFFGNKEFPSGTRDEDTDLLYGFPESDPSALPDITKTNPLLHALCALIRPDNQVHIDVSFFFITDSNRKAVQNFYRWARSYQGGFILDRMLWGSDWPLLFADSEKGKYLKTDQMKGYVNMNAREWIAMDPELWFRMAVINPVRFYNLKEIRPHLEQILGKAPLALSNPATTLEELYAQREKVMG